MSSDAWELAYEGFDPAAEPLREALCTLGNGYFATRGAAPEARADGVHYPGTYLAGGFNRLTTDIAGRTVENEDLVNFPNWLVLRFRTAGGTWLDPAMSDGAMLGYRQSLDLRNALLEREFRFEDGEGRRTRVVQRRLVHMASPHVAALETTLTPENWSGVLEVHAALDGRVVNAGVARYGQLSNRHLRTLEQGVTGDGGAVFLVVETVQSHLRVAQAARTRVTAGRERSRTAVVEDGYVGEDLQVAVSEGQAVTVDKTVVLFTSRDRAISEPGVEARTTITRTPPFAILRRGHERAWARLWERFDISVDADRRTQMIVRLHVLHLLQTVSPNSVPLDVGVPARGLHGEAYRGHIFWDELFIHPVLNLRLPAVARALLEYRHRRLPEARWAAQAEGYAGAMFPWQSGSNGREETQRLHLNPRSGRWLPDRSHLQRHVNHAVAYNVWQHYQATGDAAFLRRCGGGLLVEIARFLASLTSTDAADGRYDIRGVMGPDEYHDAYPDSDLPGLDNNAYTNVMSAWVLSRAADVFDVLPRHQAEELADELDLDAGELRRWDDISHKLRVPFHDGVISQFEGYERLAEFDWADYRERYGDIHRLDRILEAEGDSTNRYRLSKQADVLMLFYLLPDGQLKDVFARLGYPVDDDMIGRTIDYYLARTSHGSTLSSMVHAWVLARRDPTRSWELFCAALESDVADVQGGTTPEGIHLGAMAGTVDLLQRCYTGMAARDGVLWFDPALPERLAGVEFRMRFRRHRLHVTVRPDRLRVASETARADQVQVGLAESVATLDAGGVLDIAL